MILLTFALGCDEVRTYTVVCTDDHEQVTYRDTCVGVPQVAEADAGVTFTCWRNGDVHARITAPRCVVTLEAR